MEKISQISSADRLRLEILASMQAATDVQGSDRCLLSADDATDSGVSIYEESDCDDHSQSINMRAGVGLQIKTARVRKGKCEQVAQPVSHIGNGKGRADNDRTAQLMRGVTTRFALDNMSEQERTSRTWNCRIYTATTRDKTINYTINIYRNANRQQLKMWAQEDSGLYSRIIGCGVNIPEPVWCMEHILVLRNVPIGTSLGCFVLLKDFTPIRPYDLKNRYIVTLWTIRELYQRAGIVHGNVSEHTVAFQYDQYYTGKCCLSDLRHAITRQHPSHQELLIRDVALMNAFFLQRGLRPSYNFYGLIPDDVAMAYVTMEDMRQSIGEYSMGKCYCGVVGRFIPFPVPRK